MGSSCLTPSPYVCPIILRVLLRFGPPCYITLLSGTNQKRSVWWIPPNNQTNLRGRTSSEHHPIYGFNLGGFPLSQDPKLYFTSEVTEKLGYYVYRLIDPRNGETFYVGKGYGNRVFAHCADELAAEGDELKDKLRRIREIRMAQFDVEHVIHRHGMDSKTAFEVEGALIDAYPGLANQVDGYGNQDRGVMHSRQIIALYAATEAQFHHRALLINVNVTASTLNLYDATRHAWKIDPRKACKAEVILATRFGLIVGAFIAEKWLEATKDNFPGFPERPGRWGFQGREAPKDVVNLYVGKRVPDEMRKKGSANPIRYT